MVTTIEQLLADGFSRPSTTVPRRLICAVAGQERSGKTNFAFTAIEPIVYINIDRGDEGVIQKFNDKQIVTVIIEKQDKPPMPSDPSKDQKEKVIDETSRLFTPVWENFKDKFRQGLSLSGGTVVVDTFTEAYEIGQLARFGKISEVPPLFRQHLNSEIRDMLRWAKETEMNLILIHKMREKFGQPGVWEQQGPPLIPYEVQCSLITKRDVDKEGKPSFSLTVKDCRQNPNVMGMVLVDPVLSFDFLLERVHPK